MRIRILLLLMLVGTLLTGCTDNGTVAKKSNQGEKTKIVFARSPNPLATLPIVAEENGYFSDAGIEVDVKEFTTGKLCYDALIGGGADFCTVAETPVMIGGFSDQKNFVIATIESSPLSVKVLARKGSGISKEKDLAGKKVGTFKGSSAEFFLGKFLQAHEMEEGDLKITHLTPPQLSNAIISGDLDAIVIWEHYITSAATEIGDDAIIFTGEDFYTETFNIAIKQEYADKNPAIVKGFLEALVKAEEFVKSKPTETKKLLLEKISIDDTVLEKIWPIYDLQVRLDQKLIDQIEEEAKFAIESKWVKDGSELPDYRQYFEPKFLKEIDSSRTTIE